ncbi:MAG: nucleotidyltransferase domain-containing protein [Candidatus Thorarchaeota archaeon]
MQIPTGIEGDYLETKDDNLFFDIKGFHHPKDKKICFLRFYPDQNGDRVKNGIKFKKVYDINERFLIIKNKFPQYWFYSNHFDVALQGVNDKDIKNIYCPNSYFKSLGHKESLSRLESLSLKLSTLFIENSFLTEDSVGISGSSMVGLSKPGSDIDIIIYGTKSSLEFQYKLKEIYEKTNSCRNYTLNELKDHYNWRFGGSDISIQDFLKSERRKLHQGKFHEIDFFIRYIKSPEDWNGNYYDYHFTNLGRVAVKGKITNSSESIFTPCSYSIKCSKIIEHNLKNFQLDINKLTEINSYRGRYCEQAVKGENVLVVGKLEEVSYKNDEPYYRILLTDQKIDKMIVLN